MTKAVHQPLRAIVGHCPHCGNVVVVLNNTETWPMIECSCGENFSTDAISWAHRVERGFVVDNVRLTRLIKAFDAQAEMHALAEQAATPVDLP